MYVIFATLKVIQSNIKYTFYFTIVFVLQTV